MLRYFEEICKIPRGSGNERAISDYLVAFATERGLYCVRDEALNVFVRKDATPDCAHLAPILLQGHMDMVCEKNADVKHDFLTDPIEIYIEDGWMKAKGTTLGGDDGGAVAIMMALLDSDDISHPTLECLITTEEETTMKGALSFDYGMLTARRVINLDSEDEGVATASCAGMVNATYRYATDRIACPARPLRVQIKGLAGGHSGADIHLCRGNANRLMGRLLAAVYERYPFSLTSVSGGNKKNAIPREATAEFFTDHPEEVKVILLEEEARLKKELSAADSAFCIRISKGTPTEKMLTCKDTSAVINLLTLVPEGVIAMSPFVEHFVRTSSNIGIVATTEDAVELQLMARSSCDSEFDALIVNFKRFAKLVGAELELSGRLSGWDFDPRSKLAADFERIYKETFGADSRPIVNAIHAGLECGIIVAALDGNCDAISIGPTLRNIHTPDEALDLASCEKLWTLLLNMLKT